MDMRADILTTLILALALILAGCTANPVTGRQDVVLMSEQQEIDLGRKLHQEVLKQYRLYEDEKLTRYVETIGERLARVAHRPDLVFHFHVIDSAEVNAFALPGGYIYITRGIIAHLNSEAELAGVLGHEIGHVTARHSVRQHTASTFAGILAAVAAGTVGDAAGSVSNVIGTAVVRGYGRDHELEADRLGAQYLARAGYDPAHMMRVVGVLKAQETYERQRAKEEGREPRIYHGVFSTHPDNERRQREVIEAARTQMVKAVLPDNRDVFLAHLEGMIFGPGEREGAVRGNDFYHRELKVALRFPAGWRIENLPDRLRAHMPGNEALIQVTTQDQNKRIGAQEFLAERFGAGKLRDQVRLTVANGDGHAAVVDMDSPYGRRPVRVAAVIVDKRIWLFLGATKAEKLPPETDRLFLDTASGLRPIRADEYKLAEPQRVRLTRATAATKMSDLARRTTIAYHAEETLRLINGLYPAGEPAPGRLIKIIE